MFLKCSGGSFHAQYKLHGVWVIQLVGTFRLRDEKSNGVQYYNCSRCHGLIVIAGMPEGRDS